MSSNRTIHELFHENAVIILYHATKRLLRLENKNCNRKACILQNIQIFVIFLNIPFVYCSLLVNFHMLFVDREREDNLHSLFKISRGRKIKGSTSSFVKIKCRGQFVKFGLHFFALKKSFWMVELNSNLKPLGMPECS